MIQISNLSISIYKSKDDLLKKVAKELKVKQTDIIKFDVIKKSIDARKKEDVKYVYSLAVEVKEETKLLKNLPEVLIYQNMKKVPIPYRSKEV